MPYATLEFDRRGAAATIRLNRPDAMNAVNAQMAAELGAALDAVAGDDEVRAVCLTGAGRGFCSGADLKDMGGRAVTADGHPDLYAALVERYHPIITALREMPKPVVAAVNGGAAGIGCSFALACDLIVARESAYLLLSFANIGLVPDGGASLLIPTRAGMARAAEMAMLGERVPASTALAWGLVNRVLADDEFDAGATALVDRLAAGPTRAYAGIKRQLNGWLYGRMAEQLELEATVQQEMAGTGDFTEGVTAFLRKRPAAFRGA